MDLPAWHYYEAHVTIEPVFDDRLDEFRRRAEGHKFHVAKLLMKRRAQDTPEVSRLDSFCTSRDTDLERLRQRMSQLLFDLAVMGFEVRRYKIESTLIDSRYDDSMHQIERKRT